MKGFVERNFFKKRWLLSIPKELYSSREISVEGYKTFVTPNSKELHQRLPNDLNSERLEQRLSHPDISLYVAEHRLSTEIAGIYWALHPTTGYVWHDKFSVTENAALLFGAYVFPEHRRKGLYSALTATAYSHLLRTKKLERVFIIVENSNRASLKANMKFGLSITAENYLIKFLGKNILSIYRDISTNKACVHYVYRNIKSHSF